jgi:hypothetical protein
MTDAENSILNSNIICLRTPGSTRKFRIHEKLLASKSTAIHAAHANEFKEKADGESTIHDTSDETVVRFIEWAYRGEYPDHVRFIDVAPPSPEESKADVVTSPQDANHSLLSHLHVYIFADKYCVSALQMAAYDKLTANLVKLHKPDTLDYQLAVIELLDTAFKNLHRDDRLLDYLGRYAAWSIDELRKQSSFYGVLPRAAPSIIQHVSPGNEPPWNTPEPRLVVPSTLIEEGDPYKSYAYSSDDGLG